MGQLIVSVIERLSSNYNAEGVPYTEESYYIQSVLYQLVVPLCMHDIQYIMHGQAKVCSQDCIQDFFWGEGTIKSLWHSVLFLMVVFISACGLT